MQANQDRFKLDSIDDTYYGQRASKFDEKEVKSLASNVDLDEIEIPNMFDPTKMREMPKKSSTKSSTKRTI